MKRITKFVIVLIVIVAVITSYPIWILFVGPAISPILISEYLSNQPTVNVTGIIQHWRPIDGPSYSIIPEEDIDVDMTGRGIYLYGKNLTPALNNSKVTVSGILIEDYREYTSSTLRFGHGGDPYTAVIFVDDIKILEIYP